MAIQVIVYSVATGRVRRGVDPQAVEPNVIAFLNQVAIVAGEARLVYTKTGVLDDITAWQIAVCKHTGLEPVPMNPAVQAAVEAACAAASVALTQVHDRYVAVDASNNITVVGAIDPACGDVDPNGGTLFQQDFADSAWTFTPPSTFTPPAVTAKP